MNTERSAGVSRAWRVVAIGLATGIAAHVLLSLRRPAVTAATVITVRDLNTAAAEGVDPRLDRVLDAVDFDHVRLADVLRSLGDRGRINVVAGWDGLADDNVKPDTPVSVHLKAVRWSSALDAVLLVVDPKHRSAWNCHGDVVGVTDSNWASVGPVVTRLYDVQPLIDQADRYRRDHAAGTAGNPSQSAAQQTGNVDAESMDEIKNFVEHEVDPNSWKDNGGEIGTMTDWAGQVIVTQTEQNQRRTAAALLLLAERH